MCGIYINSFVCGRRSRLGRGGQPVAKIEKKSLVEIQKEEAKQAALQAEVDANAEKEQQAASVQLKMLALVELESLEV